ncbi:MAG TPA: hypothetical protein PKJ54_03645 [Candidatus Pacearchaeota archaeon]|nr:hypothetical protein [Candidatus Pacearchaeota archaeon]
MENREVIIENNINNNPLIEYVNDLANATNKDEIRAITDKILNILPENVSSLSIPFFDNTNGITLITSERTNNNIPEEKREYWGIERLINHLLEEESNNK